MKRSFFITADGSPSFRVDELKETYHSRHGAVIESTYVYIKKGIKHWLDKNQKEKCSIFELGFGTGLNAYLTANFAIQNKISIRYESVENNPLTQKEVEDLNYNTLENQTDNVVDFIGLHQSPWHKTYKIPNFSFTKQLTTFENYHKNKKFDILFYDAFGAHAQPELWSDEMMTKCFNLLNPGGVWVSYCAKGSVRRGLAGAGFIVERLPGPPGKREMLRAIKC